MTCSYKNSEKKLLPSVARRSLAEIKATEVPQVGQEPANKFRTRSVLFNFPERSHRAFSSSIFTKTFALLVAVAVISPVIMADFAAKSAEFAADLYSKVVEGKDDQNVIISPFSVQTCVGLAYAGAGGKTAEEMAKGLRLSSNDRSEVAKSFAQVLDSYSNNPTLKIANKVYVKNGYKLKAEFNEVASKSFHSEAENLDFAQNTDAAGKINSWVEQKTNNRIKDLISPSSLSADTRCVLVNAIYFKGFWEKKFEVEATQKEDFWISENDAVKVDMMNLNHKFKYGEFADLDASAVELPYKDSDLSMLIILPNTKTGLKTLESKLATFNLTEMSKNMYKNEVNLKLPRFKIEFSIQLNEPLKKMGMTSMFHGADFSNLLESNEPLEVSEVVHKAFIEVNEEGAEAAAATAVGRMKRSANFSAQPQDFDVDHPFAFSIVCRKQNISLFIGSIRTLKACKESGRLHGEL